MCEENLIIIKYINISITFSTYNTWASFKISINTPINTLFPKKSVSISLDERIT